MDVREGLSVGTCGKEFLEALFSELSIVVFTAWEQMLPHAPTTHEY